MELNQIEDLTTKTNEELIDLLISLIKTLYHKRPKQGFRLDYIVNIGSKHKPIFIVKQQGKSCDEIIAEVRNYSKLKQRRVRANEARRILNGE